MSPATTVEYAGLHGHHSAARRRRAHAPHSLYFAGWSEASGAGQSAAFVSLSPATPAAFATRLPDHRRAVPRCRAAGERQRPCDRRLRRTGAGEPGGTGTRRLLHAGTYTELVFCGERRGHPMLTFTASPDRDGSCRALGGLSPRDRRRFAGDAMASTWQSHFCTWRATWRAGRVDARRSCSRSSGHRHRAVPTRQETGSRPPAACRPPAGPHLTNPCVPRRGPLGRGGPGRLRRPPSVEAWSG